MLKYILITVFIGTSLLHGADAPNLTKLEAEKRALELKLESYTLKKKIIELENFLKQDRLEKEEKAERERALIRLRNDIRASIRNKPYLVELGYAG